MSWKASLREVGFTLVEVVIVMAITAIVALTLSGMLIAGINGWQELDDQASLRQEGQLVLARISLECREATAITVANPTDLTILMDLDRNGATESIRYQLTGDLLRRQVNGLPNPGTPVVGKVQQLSFVANGNRLTIALTLQGERRQFPLRTEVASRWF